MNAETANSTSDLQDDCCGEKNESSNLLGFKANHIISTSQALPFSVSPIPHLKSFEIRWLQFTVEESRLGSK